MSTPATLPESPTWKSRRAWIILLVVTVLGTAADLATKYVAFRCIADSPVIIRREEVLASRSLSDLIPYHEPVHVVSKLLDFTLVLNRGAVFGMGAGKRWIFIIFTGAALFFGVMLFAKWTREREWSAHAAIGLLLAGGIGNLYDRLIYACVRDFIHPLPGVHLPFGWTYPWGGAEVWPYVSNVADLFLIIGIGVLVCRALRAPHGPPKPGAGAGT